MSDCSFHIKTSVNVDTMPIDLIHKIEKDVDAAMLNNGFVRTETSKESHEVIIRYSQIQGPRACCVNPYEQCQWRMGTAA